jgi:ribosomal protein S18 acetylase RimI-like enzyme
MTSQHVQIEIAAIRPEHAEGFYDVFATVIAERKYLTYVEPPPLEKTREFVMRAIERDWPLLVAGADKTVVGWCDIMPKPQPMFAHCGVLGMALLPDYRGHGVGSRLLAQALAAAGRKGLTRLELTVFTDNQPAIALYKSHGFAIEGELVNDALIDGVYRNAYVMARIAFPASP